MPGFVVLLILASSVPAGDLPSPFPENFREKGMTSRKI
jgi:hypothetical protein